MDALNTLMLQIEWGADEALDEHPVDRRAASAPAATLDAPPPPAAAAPAGALPASPLARARALAENAANRAALQSALESFDGCALRTTATNLVFAEGDPASGLVLVADVPGAAEDRAGTPFAGPAGLFLDRMLASIRLDRSHVFMTSLIPWRPPGDRKPTETEVQLCLPFLLRHLALLRPRRVVLVGALAGRTLLPSAGRRARGVWHTLTVPSLGPLPALALAALGHIQGTPAAKRDAWGDLLLLRRALDEDEP
jgi:uracil-DNA glycosylase